MRYAFPAAIVVLILSAITGCTSPEADGADERAPRQAARRHHGDRVGPPSFVRLRIDVFTLRSPAGNGMRFSIDALNDKAADPEALLDALNAYGNANLQYRFDQEIDLGVKTELALVQEVPYVKSIKASGDRQIEAATGYRDTGCVVEVSGTWTEIEGRSVAEVLLMVQPSYIETRKIHLGSGLYAPVFSKQTIQQSVQLTDGMPALVAMPNQTGDKENETNRVSEYVVRLQVDRLEEQPEPAFATTKLALGGY